MQTATHSPDGKFRPAIDAAYDAFMEALNVMPNSREVSVAKTNLDTARLWALDAAAQEGE
jgi:hypothetical protein